MDEVLKYWPLIIAPVAVTALFFSAAKATPEELAKVKTLWTTLLLIAFCAAALGWYGYQCVRFALSDAPVTGKSVALFALNLIDFILAWLLVVLCLVYKAKQIKLAKLDGLKARLHKAELELIQATGRCAVAESQLYTDEKIHEVLALISDPPPSSAIPRIPE